MARKHSHAAARRKGTGRLSHDRRSRARVRSIRCDCLLLALARELRRVLEVVDVVVPDELEGRFCGTGATKGWRPGFTVWFKVFVGAVEASTGAEVQLRRPVRMAREVFFSYPF